MTGRKPRIFCLAAGLLVLGGPWIACSSTSSEEVGSDSGADSDTTSDTNPGDLPVVEALGVEVVRDPYGIAPLVAVLKVSHPDLIPAEVDEIQIALDDVSAEKPGFVENVQPNSVEFQTNFNMDDIVDPNQVGIPFLGLYPGEANRVSFRIYTAGAVFVGQETIPAPILEEQDDGTVSVVIYNSSAMEPGWTSMNSRVYDNLGHLRWTGPQIHQILRNGNYIDSSRMNERNLLGRLIVNRTGSVPSNFEAHHDSIELLSGNILVCVSNFSTPIITADDQVIGSLEDYVIELDYATSEIVNAWDMRMFLDVDRGTVAKENDDWLHMNTLCYDEQDDSIIASCRYQGIVKLTRNGLQGAEANKEKEMVWLMAPHLDWGAAGWDGQGDLNPADFLLTAVDSAGVPYDDDVQNNLAAPPEDREDFHWPVGQHGLEITSREGAKLRLLTFNNQASVIFDGPGSVDNQLFGDKSNDRYDELYSLMVEYEIDEDAKTVRQVWSYGEEMPEYYCSYRSGVNILKATGNRLMFSCGVDTVDMSDNPYNPHIVELTEDGEVVFHMEIVNTEQGLYRSTRVNMYHPNESAKSSTVD